MWLEGVATLFVLTRFAGHCPAFAESYRQIYEYIGSHPEAQKIYAAVETKSPLPEAAVEDSTRKSKRVDMQDFEKQYGQTSALPNSIHLFCLGNWRHAGVRSGI